MTAQSSIYPDLEVTEQEKPPSALPFSSSEAVPLQQNANSTTTTQPITEQQPLAPTICVQEPVAPIVVMRRADPVRSWIFSLCSCCDDCGAMCLVFWCPCVAAGRIYEGLGGNNTFIKGLILFLVLWWGPYLLSLFPGTSRVIRLMMFFPLLPIGYAANYTGPLRKLYNIPGNYPSDCICFLFCCCCQMPRELREVDQAQMRQRIADQTAIS